MPSLNWIGLEFQSKEIIIEVAMKHLLILVYSKDQIQAKDLVVVMQIDLVIMNHQRKKLRKPKLHLQINMISQVNLEKTNWVVPIPFTGKINRDHLVWAVRICSSSTFKTSKEADCIHHRIQAQVLTRPQKASDISA